MGKILVVGGAGYIGSHVVLEFLEDGHNVQVYDNLYSGRKENLFKEAEFIYGDILDKNKLKEVLKNNYDAIIHLASRKAAGESMIKPEEYAEQNLVGSINLLEAAAFSTTRIVIFSSSAAVYGMPKFIPLDETHPLRPINFYGYTKLEIERLLDWYDKLRSIKYASLRYFNAAGYDIKGRMTGMEKNPANLIPVIMEVAAGMRSKVEVFGDNYNTKDGTGIRDYIHVTDLAKAHLMAYQKIKETKKSTTLNLGTGTGYSVLDVINMTEKISKGKINYKIVDRRPGDPAELLAISKLAHEVLGWEAQYSDLESLVSSTWNVYKKNLPNS